MYRAAGAWDVSRGGRVQALADVPTEMVSRHIHVIISAFFIKLQNTRSAGIP
jgi:hypothetical protein